MPLPFFPSPYPDELLYGVCARYHERSRNRCLKDTVEDLFGSRNATAVVDLPNRLAYLSSQLSPKTLNTPEKLIAENTLLPFYRPFLPLERLEKVVTLMHSSSNGGAIHGLVGVMASGIPTLRFLRWCPECAASDRKDWGESYWHRCHQLVGVSLCNKHGVLLREHDHLLISDRNKHLFQPFPDVTIYDAPIEFQDGAHEHRMAVAQGVAWLLKNPDAPVLGLLALHDRYLHYLKRQDLASFSGHVAQHELLEAFVGFYGENYLIEVYSPVPGDSESNWLSGLARKPRSGKTSHPIRHLLVMRFLGVDVEDFFLAGPKEKQPFGKGPWPCLNPVASHYLKRVITRCTVTRNSESGKPVGNFYCPCGFSYARTGPDMSEEDKFHRGRMLSFGPVWETELLRLMRDEKLTLWATARVLGVDTRTVKKHLERLSSEPREVHVAPEDEKQVQAHRARWLNLCQGNVGMGKKALRALDPGTYAWLYRHDRKWLLFHPLGRVPPKTVAPRVDWEVRDAKLAADVVTAAEAIQNQLGRPVRITLLAIAKKLGILALMQQKLHKLPQTAAALKGVLEDQDGYSIRRVRYAVASIIEEGKPLEEWRVVREAALRPGYSAAVHAEIRRAINRGVSGVPVCQNPSG